MTNLESTEQWKLREIEPDEIEDFLDLMEISFKDSLEEDRIDMQEVRSLMKKMNRPHYRLLTRIMKIKSEFYVIEHEKQMASGFLLGVERDKATVVNLMTHPDYRKRGLARRLFKFAETRASDLGLKKLTLSVRAENTPAFNLYLSEGYERSYHAGKFSLDSGVQDLQLDSNQVQIQPIDQVNYDIMDAVLDDCFPSYYFESRNRKRWVKKYVPSRATRYIAKKVVGQTITTYGIFVDEESEPRGYIQASQSRVDDQISLTAPILSEKDNDLLLHGLPQIIQQEMTKSNKTNCVLSLSMHRSDTISKLEQIGFNRVRESMTMVKYLE
jgi:ribosomal protein S18 acetylase RimI-like enzyme